ncbi:MAG: hypothetical protein AB7U05_18060 [Mangrovibacterium sp.]
MKQLLLIILTLILLKANAQENKLSLHGYVKDLFMLYKPEQPMPGSNKASLTTNTLHNRLNFKWYTSEQVTVVAEMRNRLLMGSLLSEYPTYRQLVDTDQGYLDLSFISFYGDSWYVHSMIDRAYIDWTSGNWQLRVGRQRINWGINLVWNPNDVFNSFSYFDFDYEERPGTDAVKLQYYTGQTSSAELVYKASEDANETAMAGLYRFSKWNYDFQFLGGWVGPDWMMGAGWAGDIRGGGFRGEITHFEPRKQHSESEKATVISVSGDYTLKSSLYLHAGLLYNSHGKTGKAGGMDLLFNPTLSAKYLSFARWSLFGQVSYPITPLLGSGLSAIVNPGDGSLYTGPSFTYSLQNNLEFMLTGQLFFGQSGSEFGDIGQLIFTRLKWSF